MNATFVHLRRNLDSVDVDCYDVDNQNPFKFSFSIKDARKTLIDGKIVLNYDFVRTKPKINECRVGRIQLARSGHSDLTLTFPEDEFRCLICALEKELEGLL